MQVCHITSQKIAFIKVAIKTIRFYAIVGCAVWNFIAQKKISTEHFPDKWKV